MPPGLNHMRKTFNHVQPRSHLNVLQLSDLHLFADPASTLVGLNTEHTFLSVLEKSRQDHWPPDLILLTGDLSQDSSEAAYTRLQAHLEPLSIPCYTLPGNHDVPETMNQLSRGSIHQQPFLHLEHWLIAFLDSTIPDEEGGQLRDDEIENLRQELAKNPDKNTLICLHHQLLPVGSTWLDTMAVKNPQPLIDLIESNPQVKAVAHGHVHQEFQDRIGNTPIFSVPSTCFQFKPKSHEFEIDSIPPGYRWLVLNEDGSFETGVERLADVPGNLEQQSHGY